MHLVTAEAEIIMKYQIFQFKISSKRFTVSDAKQGREFHYLPTYLGPGVA
jgi:hypothetical protein